LIDAEYEIDGAWRALGGFFERETTNRQAFTFEGDSKVRGVEGGVRYVFPSGTSLAYRLKQGNGEYPGRITSAQFASDFKDREHEVRLDWPLTGKTTIESRISHFDRTHEGLAARDFSGFIGQVKATWEATAKTRVIAGLGRELSSYQTDTSSYYEGYQVFIAPTWKATAKTSVQFRYEHGVRDYKGALPGFSSLNRRDTLDIASLAFEWQPTRAVTVTASALRDNRKSDAPGFDYKSNGVNLSVLARF
jgi:exopolysaccharide biosynthesis operon protein EpsL